MKYIFVKEFNPAYDQFFTKYFREHGVNIDENTSLKELENKTRNLDQRNASEAERLLISYVREWGSHPEYRPSLYYLLDKTLGGKGRPDLDTIYRLESKLSPKQGKLLFGSEEVAADISGFYKKYMRIPLKSDIERGASDRRLTAYFSLKEARPSEVGPEGKKRERDTYQIAVELLSWLEGITSEKVARDLDRIIEEHESNSEHMRESVGSLPGRPAERKKVCMHESEYLKLQVYQHLEDGAVSVFLFPSRGFRISDTVLEEGWNDAVFPEYYMIQTQNHGERLFQTNNKNTTYKRQSEAEMEPVG